MKPRRCYSVKLTIDKPIKVMGGETRVFRENVTFGIIARDVESAITEAKELLAGKNPEVFAVNHQIQIDGEAPETPKAAPSGTASTVNQTEVSAS